jgi:phytoene dehydrogenase-like protein
MEAFVVGSGPNGLTAAITLARAGLKVTVLEAQSTIGGGVRSLPLTLPGFIHDVCSAVHPMAISSPAFTGMPLREHGLEWIHPPIPVTHPLDGGHSVAVEMSVDATAAQLGPDAAVYRRIVKPLVPRYSRILEDVLGPPHFPAHPLTLARFGLLAPWSASRAARTLFRAEPARAFFSGMAAHSILRLETAGSAAFGWIFALSAHAAGWPIPRGGSQRIADALVSYLKSLGGRVLPDQEVRSLNDLPANTLVLCDITPRQLLRMAGGHLPDSYCLKLERYRYGPGVFKVDWALNSPIPWQNFECTRAGTVHVGGSFDEIAFSERAPWNGETCERPFVLLAQPSLFDNSRAPAGKHTAWAYCHVPNGWTPSSPGDDMTARIEAQVERFAPGFRNTILARHTMTPADLERHNANLVGGDVTGGAADLEQLLFRPTSSYYRTPARGVFLCSSSTPPGAGVHGMCGYHAARVALREIKRPVPHGRASK